MTIGKNTIVKFKEDIHFGDDEILILEDYIKPLGNDVSSWNEIIDDTTKWKFGVASELMKNEF